MSPMLDWGCQFARQLVSERFQDSDHEKEASREGRYGLNCFFACSGEQPAALLKICHDKSETGARGGEKGRNSAAVPGLSSQETQVLLTRLKAHWAHNLA